MKNMFLSRKEKKKEEAAPQGGGISRALGKVSFEGFDWWLFTLMLIILAIGLIMVLSASGIVAEQGSPQELMAQDGLFARMVRLQTESAEWAL